MREIIKSTLKTRFEGVSDNIIDRVADKLAKTVNTEEAARAAVEAFTLQQLLESYGDWRATGAQQTAVANYERKHGLKDGKPMAAPDTATGDDPDPKPAAAPSKSDDVPAWAAALIEANKALTERLNKLDTDRTATTRKAQLAQVIDRLPATHRKAYERLPLDTLTDEQFTALLDEVKPEVETILGEAQARGAVFGKPTTGNIVAPRQATPAEVDAVIEKMNI